MRAIRVLALVAITAGPALWVATCGGDGGTDPTPPPPTPPPANRAPTASGSVPAATITAGESVTVNVASAFSDPDGDVLSYTATTSDAGVATASVSGSNVTVTGVAAGSATITVTARDPGGLTATQSVGVTVEAANQAPVAEGTIENQTMDAGTEVTVDVAAFFSDPDGDELTYAASSSDTAVATVSTSDASLTVMAIKAGSATVTVTATDPGGLSASHEFGLVVAAVTGTNRAPQVTASILAQTLVVGDTVRLDGSAHFSDPDGDDLSYGAASSNASVATAAVTGANNAMIEIAAVAAGDATVTVSASDPEGLSAEQQVTVTVNAAAVTVADTIPTHDVMVDSVVTLDVSPYFEGGGLTYTATTSDAAVASVDVDGTTVNTRGVSGDQNAIISEAFLSVTATNAGGGSATQEQILVRVHQEAYDTLPGISVSEDGTLLAELTPGSSLPLTFCLQIADYDVGGQKFTIFWSEWQRAVGGGWVVAQDNNKAHEGQVTHDPSNPAGSICPITISDEKFPAGTYRLVGYVQIGEETGYYKTPSFVKQQEG